MDSLLNEITVCTFDGRLCQEEVLAKLETFKLDEKQPE